MGLRARRRSPPELELELIWHRSQCCGVKWGARVLRVRLVSREEVWASAGVQGPPAACPSIVFSRFAGARFSLSRTGLLEH